MTLSSGYAATATSNAPTRKRGGCGCGGGSASGGGGCSGGGGGGAPAHGSAFVRPQFFGGMLLTEDDLQAVTDYVIGKRRLTNRYVFGPGVVCGLDISCEPCESGVVVVGPGYAIDCCGNDVLLDCPTQVDVIALVRELRQRSGVDCGEPCDDQPCHSYVLNVVYTEQPSDPVAPYADDSCAVGDCEYSRVREGYRFELSCDAPEPEPSIADILRACLNVDDDRVKEDAAVMAKVVRLGMSREERQPTAELGEPAAAAWAATAAPDIPLKKEFDALDHEDAEFGPAMDLVTRATVALAQDAAAQEDRGPSIGLNAERRKLISTRTRLMARRLLASDELAAMSDTDRSEAVRLLKVADEQRNLAKLSETDGFPLLEKPDGSAEEIYRRDGLRMKGRVLRELADSGRAGCQEYRAVSALKFATLDQDSPREVRVLGRTFVSVLMRCVCAAANPKCPSCTDARIPLARLRVEGCDVVSVCDLERHWVNSPRALGYWFPVVEALREVLDKRCCPDDCEDRHDDKEANLSAAPISAYAQRRTRDREVDVLRDQAVMLLRLVSPPEDVPVLREVLDALGDEFLDSRPQAVFTPEPPAAEPSKEDARVAVLEKQVADLNKRLEELARKQP